LASILQASSPRAGVITIRPLTGALIRFIKFYANAMCGTFGDVKDKRIFSFFDFVAASDLRSLGHLGE
jgi:hypothetical protein